MSVFHDAPEILAENTLAFAVHDKYPSAPGHVLVCTKREVASWFDTTAEEQRAVLDLVAQFGNIATGLRGANGCRVLINTDGAQHIPHVHVHVIPHYSDSPSKWV